MTNLWYAIGLRLMTVLLGLLLLALAVGAALTDGSQIAYASAQDGDLDIYLLDIAHGITVNLTHTPESETQPNWSPDGSRIVFVSPQDGNTNLYMMQVRCPSLFAACNVPVRRLTSQSGSDISPAWSPDGTKIAYTSEAFGSGEIMLIDVISGEVERLTDNDRLDANPVWSPDGTQIVFASDRGIQWNTDLYLMDADGSHPRALLQTPDNEFAAAWSPDGSRLIFGSSTSATIQLFFLDIANGQISPWFDDEGFYITPSWSPDGEILALSAFHTGDYEVYTVRLDCEGIPADCLHRLTFNPAIDTNPVWRP